MEGARAGRWLPSFNVPGAFVPDLSALHHPQCPNNLFSLDTGDMAPGTNFDHSGWKVDAHDLDRGRREGNSHAGLDPLS